MKSPRDLIRTWPAARQLTGEDRLGRGAAVKSKGSRENVARTRTADRVVKSVCPYCAVGCGQNVFVSDGHVTQIEGDPDAPHSRGRLCPKGSATKQLTTGSSREGSANVERLASRPLRSKFTASRSSFSSTSSAAKFSKSAIWAWMVTV